MNLPAAHTLTVTIPGPPQPKERPRLGRGGNVYTPDKTKRYESLCRHLYTLAANQQRWTPKDGARYEVTIWLRFPDARRRDADNGAKSLLDAGNGVLWRDDADVCDLHVFRRIDRERPSATVSVRVVMQPLAKGIVG